MGDCDTKQWVVAVQKGDKKAYEKLFLRFYGPLCKFAWRMVRSSAISKELVQEVFLKVWKERARLDPEKSIKTYLYQAVRNSGINHLKHEQLAQKYNREIDWLNPVSPVQSHQFEEDSAFITAARQAIEQLPPKARQIYLLSRKDGLTYPEIAQVLDISPKTVEYQMSKALKILQTTLSPYLGTVASY